MVSVLQSEDLDVKAELTQKQLLDPLHQRSHSLRFAYRYRDAVRRGNDGFHAEGHGGAARYFSRRLPFTKFKGAVSVFSPIIFLLSNFFSSQSLCQTHLQSLKFQRGACIYPRPSLDKFHSHSQGVRSRTQDLSGNSGFAKICLSKYSRNN